MADAHGYDSAEAVEISLLGVVSDVLHFAFHEHDGLLVVQKNSGIQKLFAQGEDLAGGWTGVRCGLMVERGQRDALHKIAALLSSKFQAPTSGEAPNTRLQFCIHAAIGVWSLKFLWSLELGIWSFFMR